MPLQSSCTLWMSHAKPTPNTQPTQEVGQVINDVAGVLWRTRHAAQGAGVMQQIHQSLSELRRLKLENTTPGLVPGVVFVIYIMSTCYAFGL